MLIVKRIPRVLVFLGALVVLGWSAGASPRATAASADFPTNATTACGPVAGRPHTVSCTVTPFDSSNHTPVADGTLSFVVVSHTGGRVALHCGSASPAPAGPCAVVSSTQIDAPCGSTAPGGTSLSNTCGEVTFSKKTNGTAVIEVVYHSTPGNALGPTGVVLTTFTVTG
jgi:hypothetical protein